MNVPFRIGGTLFIYRDRWLPSVERLANWFDDIEILLFERECGVPDEAELRTGPSLRNRFLANYRILARNCRSFGLPGYIRFTGAIRQDLGQC